MKKLSIFGKQFVKDIKDNLDVILEDIKYTHECKLKWENAHDYPSDFAALQLAQNPRSGIKG